MKENIKINLQLFAEGENIEDTADLNTDVDNTNVDDNQGDQQPEVDATPEDQSNDKDNPANHAFAEMRRNNAQLKRENEAMKQRQVESDKYYANLAKSKGRNDINTADDYFKAVRQEELATAYTETNDPLKLVELFKESVFSDPRLSQPKQEPIIDNGLDKEVEEFNKEFKGTLKSIDDILTLPNSSEVISYMQNNGLPLNKAYALANPDKIKAATKQAAINQVRGNAHITANNNGGNVDSIQVTATDIEQWKRRHGSSKTDEQCRKELIAVKKLMID